MGDRPPWNNRRSPDSATSPTLQQMFALARKMGYEMRPIARQRDTQRQSQGNRSFPDQNRGFRMQARTGRDYSRIKCFSCGEFGHMQGRCPRPDASLPFRPAGWHLQSDNRQQRDGDNHQGNFTYTGHSDHTYSSISEFMYRSMHVTRGSGSCGSTGGVFTRR